MKHFMIFMMIFPILFLSASCQEGPKTVREKVDLQYTPYSGFQTRTPVLYNTVFNFTKKLLIKNVNEALPSQPKVIGLISEIKDDGTRTDNMNIIMEREAERTWAVYVNEIVPAEDIATDGASSADTHPKAKYFIVLDPENENIATVYIRVWILEYRNIDRVYTFEKRGGNWMHTYTVER